MKIITKTPLLVLFITLFSFTVVIENNWFTDIAKAKIESKQNNKLIFLSFSGSDWCSNCKRLEKTIFETEEFKKFAQNRLVLLRADFPMKKKNKLSKEQTAHNEKLADRYNKKGVFPSIFLLNESGDIVTNLSGNYSDVTEFKKIIEGYLK
jgi:thioredoxin-related protein